MECGCQALPEGEEVLLVHTQEVGPHRHGGITEEGEQTTAVQQQIGDKSLRPNPIKDGSVNIQCLEMDTGGEVRMEALGEPLADCQLERDDRVLHVGQQYLCTRTPVIAYVL